ncbi:hypothetical protein ISR92_01215 [Patescibacteria group bacterium]|nr:hypothetical protein [Patescibacteria group bacterium]
MENRLQEFIVKAHKATYASGEGANINANGASQYNFSEGDYEYIDIYYGGPHFIGSEIVKEKGEPIWGMSYYGHTYDMSIDGEKFSSFLKKMISKTEPGILLRGPKKWKEKEWSYRYGYKGSVGDFTAEEIIKFKGKKVFIVKFNGGLVKK